MYNLLKRGFSLILVGSILSSFVYAFGAEKQATTDEVSTIEIDGILYTVTTQTDPIHDTTLSTVESSNEIVETFRDGTTITQTSTDKDANGEPILSTQTSETTELVSSIGGLDTILPEPRKSLVEDYRSKYFDDDFYLLYTANEWHIYYARQEVNSGPTPSASMSNACHSFATDLQGAEQSLDNFVTAVAGFAKFKESVLAGAVLDAANVNATTTAKFLSFCNGVKYLQILTGEVSIMSFGGLAAANHANYHNDWKTAKSLL